MNLGTLDRTLRIVLGTLLLVGFLLIPGWGRWLSLAGILPLITASLGWCPIYELFGLNTCGRGDDCRDDGAKPGTEPPRHR